MKGLSHEYDEKGRCSERRRQFLNLAKAPPARSSVIINPLSTSAAKGVTDGHDERPQQCTDHCRYSLIMKVGLVEGIQTAEISPRKHRHLAPFKEGKFGAIWHQMASTATLRLQYISISTTNMPLIPRGMVPLFAVATITNATVFVTAVIMGTMR